MVFHNRFHSSDRFYEMTSGMGFLPMPLILILVIEHPNLSKGPIRKTSRDSFPSPSGSLRLHTLQKETASRIYSAKSSVLHDVSLQKRVS